MKIHIGKSLRRKSAGEAKTLLEKRYLGGKAQSARKEAGLDPITKKDIDETVEHYWGKDEGAEKLNADGDSGADKSKSATSKK